MVARVDLDETESALVGAASVVDEAVALGRQLAGHIDRVYLVACGAPNRLMLGLQYWIEHYSRSFEVRRYFPAEFVTQMPPRLDERTLVVIGSNSGTTKEIIEAAMFLRDYPAITVGFTTTADKPLAKAVKHVVCSSESAQDIVGLPHASMAIAMTGFMGGLLAAKDGWRPEAKLLASLKALPKSVAAAKAGNEARAAREAKELRDDKIIYQIASGPMFSTAYVFGVCTLMEMQWLHSTPLESAEFFHGPFEVVDENVPIFLLLGEDPSRPLMERTFKFCKTYGKRLYIYDSRDFEMPGIDPEIRPIVAPFIIGVALDRFCEHLADLHDHPLETRRYMWKVDY